MCILRIVDVVKLKKMLQSFIISKISEWRCLSTVKSFNKYEIYST